MSLDWHILVANWAEILVFLFALIVVKAVLVSAAARAFRWSMPGSVQLGFLLDQGNKFVFVIIAMQMVREALSQGTVGVVITGIAASLVLTPTLAALGNRLARMLRQRLNASVPTGETLPSATTAPVIMFGMDDVGRTVVDALKTNDVPCEAIEMDYDLAAAVLRCQRVDEAKIQAWMRRQQEHALQATVDLADSRAASVAV